MSLIIKGDIIGLGDSSVIEDLQIVDDTLLNTVSKTDLKDDQNFALAKENLINPVIDTTSTVHEVAANVLEDDAKKTSLETENLKNPLIETASKDDKVVTANVLDLLNDGHLCVLDTTSTVHEVAANVLESYTDLVADDYTFALAKGDNLNQGQIHEMATIPICTNIIDGLASTPSAHRRSQRTRKSTPSKYPR